MKLIYIWKLLFFKSERLKPKKSRWKPVVKFELTGKHRFKEWPEDKVSRMHTNYHGPIRRRLEVSKYEIKVGVKDKSKNDVQVFSPPQQKSRSQGILTNLYLKFKSYQPCKKTRVYMFLKLPTLFKCKNYHLLKVFSDFLYRLFQVSSSSYVHSWMGLCTSFVLCGDDETAAQRN